MIIGDGNVIKITHIGHTTLSSPYHKFILKDVLCALAIHKNLIFVPQFYEQNKTSIEFFPNFFVVKDLRTEAPLAQIELEHMNGLDPHH